MSRQDKKIFARLALLARIIALGAIVIWGGCKKGAGEKNDIESYRHEIAPSESVPDSQSKSPQLDTELKTSTKMSLSNIIGSAKTWRPAYLSLYGKAASDFTLPDIYGQQHQLSGYRGKNVIINFWATWCPGCKIQIPDLIALRNLTSEDKLTILAISFITRRPSNTTAMVKSYVEQNKISYPVISVDMSYLPAPYNQITSIPCSFFINSEGKIKLATEGIIPLSDMKDILEAEY